jgi:hypothetical protein
MAGEPVVHIGENSPEQIAYKLMMHISKIEGVAMHSSPSSGWRAGDRKWLLDTFKECIDAVKGIR